MKICVNVGNPRSLVQTVSHIKDNLNPTFIVIIGPRCLLDTGLPK